MHVMELSLRGEKDTRVQLVYSRIKVQVGHEVLEARVVEDYHLSEHKPIHHVNRELRKIIVAELEKRIFEGL